MKNYVRRDASLQREAVTAAEPKQAGFRDVQRDRSVAQFEAFSSAEGRTDFRNDFVLETSVQRAFSPGAPHDVGYMACAPQKPLAHAMQRPAAEGDWTVEFQELSLRDGFMNEQQQTRAIPFGRREHFGQISHLAQYAPLGCMNRPGQFGQFGPQFGAQNGIFQGDGCHSSDVALDAAFKDAEQSLQRLHQRDELKGERLSSLAKGRGESASAVATSIINKVNERADPELATKVRGSKFMNLMGKLQSNEIKLDAHEFVDPVTNAALDPESLHHHHTSEDLSSTQDWPPQRQTSIAIEREQPPEVAEEPQRMYRFSRDLDDPETYLRKLRKNLDPRLFTKSPYLSPFFHAQELSSPPAVNLSAWEEKYQEW